VLACYWGAIRQLIEAIRQLMALPPEPKQWGRIGFGHANGTGSGGIPAGDRHSTGTCTTQLAPAMLPITPIALSRV
jgi:hypothetical protein